jgi:ribosome maturation factor RimP
MSLILKRVTELVEEKIAEIGATDLFIVEIKMTNTTNKLLIIIDGDMGVTIEQCMAISRYVGYILEEENLIDDAYTLEVSSSGIGQPLLLHRQYIKNIGRDLILKMNDKSKLEGTLKSVNEKGIVIEEAIKDKGKKSIQMEKFLDFDDITSACVAVSFK